MISPCGFARAATPCTRRVDWHLHPRICAASGKSASPAPGRSAPPPQSPSPAPQARSGRSVPAGPRFSRLPICAIRSRTSNPPRTPTIPATSPQCSFNVPVLPSPHDRSPRPPHGRPRRPPLRRQDGAAEGGALVAEAEPAQRPRPAQADGAENRRAPGALRHPLHPEGPSAAAWHTRPPALAATG